MFAIINNAAPAARSIRPDVPVELDRLLGDCLRKDPAHRPSSAATIGDALRRIRDGRSGPTQGAPGERRDPGDRGAPVPQRLPGPGAGVLRRRHDRGHHLRPGAHPGAPGDLAHLGDEVQGHWALAARDRPRAERRRRARGLGAPGRQPRAPERAARLGAGRRDALGRPLRPRARGRPRPAERARRDGGARDRDQADSDRSHPARAARPGEPGGASRVPAEPAFLLRGLTAGGRSGAAPRPARAGARPDPRACLVRARGLPCVPRPPGDGAAGGGLRRGYGRRDQGARSGSVARRRACGARRHPIPLRRSGRRPAQPAEGGRAEPGAGRGARPPRAGALLVRTPRRGDRRDAPRPRAWTRCRCSSEPASATRTTTRASTRSRSSTTGWRSSSTRDSTAPTPTSRARSRRSACSTRREPSTRRGGASRAASRARRSGSRTSRPPRETSTRRAASWPS